MVKLKLDLLKSTIKTTTFSKKLIQKKVLIPVILGVGIMLSAIFILSSPFDSTWAQQQQQPPLRGFNKASDMSEYAEIPKVNGSVNVRDGIKNFLVGNTSSIYNRCTNRAGPDS